MTHLQVSQPTLYRMRCESKKQLTRSVYEYAFSLLDPLMLTYIPGQFGTVIVSPTLRRSYSFCSWDDGGNRVSLVVDTAPGGPGSLFFLGLEIGAEVSMMAPLGHFHLPESFLHAVCVATGTGIAPFVSMFDYLSSHTNGVGFGSIRFYWGLRSKEDLYWEEKLKQFTATIPDFSYDIILSREQGEWSGKRGHVTEYVLEEGKNHPDAHFCFCGNGTMIAEVEQRLISGGISQEHILKDVYFK